MATVQRRRRDLIASRRPVAEEGEEGGEDYNIELDDSLSDDSGLSEEEEEEEEDDEDEDEDDDISEGEEEGKGKAVPVEQATKGIGQITIERPPPREATTVKTNGTASKSASVVPKSNGSAKSLLKAESAGRLDTEFMVNGLKIDDQLEVEAVDFDDIDEEGLVPDKKQPDEATQAKPITRPSEKHQTTEKPKQQPVRHETPFERRRREHEEYKKKRDADPAFVPNRGAFFMHDHRHQGGGGNGFKPFGRGGRGGRSGMFGRGMGFGREGPEPLETTWKHDGFEELLAAERPKTKPQPPSRPQPSSRPQHPPKQESARKFQPVNEKPTIQIIVNLPGMKLPITFNEVPLRTHLRLPYHRPPLRRDKPVRVSMPDQPIKYIYPHSTRSFVFIPRAMRPGGPGFIGGGAQSTVKKGGLLRGSTRSIYAGSTQSAAMSRKSSSLPDSITQPASPTPAHATSSQPPAPSSQPIPDVSTAPEPKEATAEPPVQPTVKLPPAAELVAKPATDISNQANNIQSSPANKTTVPVTIKPPHSFPTPVPPIHDARGTPIIPMHQPRPQKTVSVADIETPVSTMHYATNPYLPSQPQGYVDMINGTETPNNNYPNNIYTHSRHPSYQSQPPSTNTPLSQLPDRAVHAQPFQPQSAAVYSAPYGAATHYYPSPQAPAHAHPAHHQHPTMYHQPPPAYSASPQYVASSMANTTPTAYQSVPVGTQGQTIAQESGGTVYFYDPSTYYAYMTAQGGYGAPLTPAPETGGIGVPSGGTVYYYPTPGTVYYQ